MKNADIKNIICIYLVLQKSTKYYGTLWQSKQVTGIFVCNSSVLYSKLAI